MSRLTRDGTAEPVSRDQIFRRERGQGNIYFTWSVDHGQDGQPYPVNPYSCYSIRVTIHTYILLLEKNRFCPIIGIIVVAADKNGLDTVIIVSNRCCMYLTNYIPSINMPTSYQWWVWEREAHIIGPW